MLTHITLLLSHSCQCQVHAVSVNTLYVNAAVPRCSVSLAKANQERERMQQKLQNLEKKPHRPDQPPSPPSRVRSLVSHPTVLPLAVCCCLFFCTYLLRCIECTRGRGGICCCIRSSPTIGPSNDRGVGTDKLLPVVLTNECALIIWCRLLRLEIHFE